MVRIARAYRPGIAVIVLSADEDSSLGPETLSLEVAGILGKPISLQELTGLVDTLRLPKERPAPPTLDQRLNGFRDRPPADHPTGGVT